MSWYSKTKDATEDMSNEEFEEAFGSYLKPVESECISHVGYYEPLGILEVRFRRSGQKYTYSGIPKEIYEELMDSKSKGEFYNRVIRPKYKGSLNLE